MVCGRVAATPRARRGWSVDVSRRRRAATQMCKTGENAESQAKMLHVVAVAALLRGAVACGSCCDDAGEPMSVGVVGAGFAGLGAATRLAELGCSVTVLEARARAGGRAETKSVGGYDVDIGAQWLHGMRRHPLLPFIEAYGMTWTPTDYGDAVAYNATSPTPRVPSSVLDAWGESWEDEVYPQARGPRRRRPLRGPAPRATAPRARRHRPLPAAIDRSANPRRHRPLRG